jgi:hypothetical protein
VLSCGLQSGTKPVEPKQLLAVLRSNNQGSGGR